MWLKTPAPLLIGRCAPDLGIQSFGEIRSPCQTPAFSSSGWFAKQNESHFRTVVTRNLPFGENYWGCCFSILPTKWLRSTKQNESRLRLPALDGRSNRKHAELVRLCVPFCETKPIAPLYRNRTNYLPDGRGGRVHALPDEKTVLQNEANGPFCRTQRIPIPNTSITPSPALRDRATRSTACLAR
jgi:hypothetical protein